MITTVLNTKISDVQNKVPDTSSLVTTTVLKTGKLRIKFLIMLNILLLGNINKITAEHFPARLKEVDLVSKNDFDSKLTSFNKRITSNKKNHWEVQW